MQKTMMNNYSKSQCRYFFNKGLNLKDRPINGLILLDQIVMNVIHFYMGISILAILWIPKSIGKLTSTTLEEIFCSSQPVFFAFAGGYNTSGSLGIAIYRF